MPQRRTKRKSQRNFISKASIIFLLLLLVFLSKATYNVYGKARESAENLARVNGALAETQSRKESLLKHTEKLNTAQGKEDEIRHKFQVAKEGEKVIVVIDDEPEELSTTTDTSLFSRFKDAIITKISGDEEQTENPQPQPEPDEEEPKPDPDEEEPEEPEKPSLRERIKQRIENKIEETENKTEETKKVLPNL
jgi:hypothetical protein